MVLIKMLDSGSGKDMLASACCTYIATALQMLNMAMLKRVSIIMLQCSSVHFSFMSAFHKSCVGQDASLQRTRDSLSFAPYYTLYDLQHLNDRECRRSMLFACSTQVFCHNAHIKCPTFSIYCNYAERKVTHKVSYLPLHMTSTQPSKC